MKCVLLIAFHYPPSSGSSGLQRTLKFSRFLLDYGWQPAVLTAAERAYPQVSGEQVAEVPADIEVRRTFALDAARHLSLRGVYPSWLAQPDRWSSWWLGAVPAGLSMIRRNRIDAIWSTFPIPTAHLIGHSLARLTGRPWVADFRDSMTEEDYPRNLRVRRLLQAIERRTVTRAQRSVFTAPGTLRMYRDRYPELEADRLRVIANGYDEANFLAAARQVRRDASRARPLKLLHSGALYPSERDPRALFAALAELKRAGDVDATQLRVVLRATGHDTEIAALIRGAAVEDLVELVPPLGYEAALAEMMSADALLLLQAANCNHQIPAKLYEYLRSGRPILALTDPAGDTAQQLRAAGTGIIAPLDRADAIGKRLLELIPALRSGEVYGAAADIAARYSRRAQAGELAALLDELLCEAPSTIPTGARAARGE